MATTGLRVAIRLSPRAEADRLVAIAATAEARRVAQSDGYRAAPEGGRANEALLQLLARAWHLPRRDLSIVAGADQPNKVVRVAGDAQQLVEQVAPEIARPARLVRRRAR